jgi:hypothetical protein
VSAAAGYQYVWLLWSTAFLCPWLVLYLYWPEFRQRMVRVSLLTSLLGLTEPIFVPEYWNPPTLFDLAQRTGFDLESMVFCFAIGGIGTMLYNALARRTSRAVTQPERHAARHRFHRLALAAPFVVFPPLYFLPWNPIYPGISALAVGGGAATLCRPDLARNTAIGGAVFLALYGAFMLTLRMWAPGYIERVWNLPALSGVLIAGVPLEELLFGLAFGLYWSAAYEHFAWVR